MEKQSKTEIPDKEKLELEEQDRVNKDLCKTIRNDHILRGMLVSWLLFPVLLTILIFVPYVLLRIGIIPIISNPLQVEVTTLQTLNSDVFIATITVIGILLGIVPILSFFYLGELKNVAQETHDAIQEDKLRKSKRLKELLDVEEGLHKILHTKLRKTVKKYTEYTVVASLISLMLILIMYSYLSFQNSIMNNGTINSSIADNVALNVIFNLTILSYAVAEVLPLVGLALFDEGYKVVTLINVKSGEECTAFIPD